MLKRKNKIAVHSDFDGFGINLFVDEDGQYIAHFVELPGISAFADTADEALQELSTVWILAKETYSKCGMPIPSSPAKAKLIKNDTNHHPVLI